MVFTQSLFKLLLFKIYKFDGHIYDVYEQIVKEQDKEIDNGSIIGGELD